MLLLRLLMVGFFALTAISLISYQSIEIYHAFINFIQDKHELK